MIKYILVFLIPFCLFTQSNDQKYYDIYNSLNIFGNAYEQLNRSYVSELDANELIKQSIIGMVSELDPYTRYEENDGESQTDYISTGYYIGFGFSVDKIDSKHTIVKILDGYSAEKSGMRIGDEIISIDDINVTNISQDSIRSLFLGKSGSSSTFKYYRLGTTDTLTKKLIRTEVGIRDVPFQKMINDSVAYIKLDQFSVKADFAFRKALRELEYEGNFNSLIIDLRDNPGGVMQASLRILELFLPNNTLMLTTRGKLAENTNEYYSRTEPKYPNVKVAVLINDGSASASEIVAGALQDTDRGIIIGKKSFGKGLVQNAVNFSDGSKLKMTIAKYYTPSGRCIQKIDYNIEKNQYDLDSKTLFKTKNGRDVNKEDGISPDKYVKDKERPEIINNLIKSDIIFNFAVTYSSKFEKSAENYLFHEENFNLFLDFLDKGNKYYKLEELNPIKVLSKKKYKTILSSLSQDNLLVLESSIKNDLKKNIIDNKTQIVELINDLVIYILKGREFTFFDRLESDKYIIEALDSFKNNYENLLKASTKVDSDNQ